jgi:hypothetical protein
MRVCTGKRGPGELPGDVPTYRGYPLRFIGTLVAARVAMLFGR